VRSPSRCSLRDDADRRPRCMSGRCDCASAVPRWGEEREACGSACSCPPFGPPKIHGERREREVVVGRELAGLGEVLDDGRGLGGDEASGNAARLDPDRRSLSVSPHSVLECSGLHARSRRTCGCRAARVLRVAKSPELDVGHDPGRSAIERVHLDDARSPGRTAPTCPSTACTGRCPSRRWRRPSGHHFAGRWILRDLAPPACGGRRR
jgi:hypothetical protein